MNYLKHYILLMRKRIINPISRNERGERHHIFPVSIFGKNSRIVKLTVREHFVAHKLLYKICEVRYGPNHNRTIRMLFALKHMMTDKRNSRLISEMVTSSKLFDKIRSAHCTMLPETRRKISASKMGIKLEKLKGDNNPAKRPENRQKISASKMGKERKDLKGKSYFGADEETVSKGIEKMRAKKTGMKISYPKGRKSSPCSEDKANKISQSRLQTKERFISMSEDEFKTWIEKQNLFAKDGKRKNSNVTRVLIWRGIDLNEYYQV